LFVGGQGKTITGPLLVVIPVKDEYTEVHVTYVLPTRILQWAITQVERYGRIPASKHDHQIAILISAHRETKVAHVRIDANSGKR
jgi:hypothetical protein